MTITCLAPEARANRGLLEPAPVETAAILAPTGRGAWTDIGMPTQGDPYYDYRTPENVGRAGTFPNADLSHRAVMWGTWQIQHRITHYSGAPQFTPSGVFDQRTELALAWAQEHIGVTPDAQAGPTTCLHLFWPYLNSLTKYSQTTRHIVGGIAQHESGYDPGAVGFSTPDDLGLVQINGPANPTLTEQQRFNYIDAFNYALNRIQAALTTPGFTEDAAIASYGYPAVAEYWATHNGEEQYPPDPTLNDTALKYVAFIKNWNPGF